MHLTALRRHHGRVAVLVLSAVVGLLVMVGSARAATCDNTWTGAVSNDWGTPGNWSAGQVPGAGQVNTAGQNVCLPGGASNYPVQLTPYDVFEQNVGNVPVQDTQLNNLSIAAGAGLVVHGESYVDRGDGYQQTVLTVDGSGTIAAGGSLELLASDDGPVTPEQVHGGSGFLNGAGTITNDGTFSSVSTTTQATAGYATAFHNALSIDFVNAPGSSGTVSSGYLDLGNGATNTVTNQSSWTVAPGATELVPTGVINTGGATFANQGDYVNSGTTQVGATGGNGSVAVFSQAGPESGNPIDLASGSELQDASGTGSFLMNNQSSELAGTIPPGQTLTIEGDGSPYTNTVTLEGSQVVNQGTLVLNSPNASSDQGASDTHLVGSSLVNQGTIDVTNASPGLVNEVDVSIANQHGATIDVQNGELKLQGNGQTVTNDGTVVVAPTATVAGNASPFNGGPTVFTNAADGTLVPQIAGASSYGTFAPQSAATFNVGGTITPQLVGGFVPAVGAAFAIVQEGTSSTRLSGTFAAVGGGFVADYSKESAVPGTISLDYASVPAATAGSGTSGAGGTGTGTPTGTGGTAAKLGVGRPKVSGETVRARLTCPTGGSCPTATVRATVREVLRGGKVIGLVGVGRTPRTGVRYRTVTVASAHSRVPAGASRTVTLHLSRTGRGLIARFGKLKLTVKVSAAAVRARSFSVTVHKPTTHTSHRKRR